MEQCRSRCRPCSINTEINVMGGGALGSCPIPHFHVYARVIGIIDVCRRIPRVGYAHSRVIWITVGGSLERGDAQAREDISAAVPEEGSILGGIHRVGYGR